MPITNGVISKIIVILLIIQNCDDYFDTIDNSNINFTGIMGVANSVVNVFVLNLFMYISLSAQFLFYAGFVSTTQRVFTMFCRQALIVIL